MQSPIRSRSFDRRHELLYGLGISVLFALLATTLWQSRAWAAQAPTPVVVELFTSEGCSSCPPADTLLRRLSAEQSTSGAYVIALSEHVDYWDGYGWNDRFASSQFTQRQRWYARERFGSNRIYTPQMVVDGAYEFVGSHANKAQAAIERAAQAPKMPVDLGVTMRSSEGPAQVAIQTAALPSGNAGGADIWLAVTQDDLQTRVAGGENGGAVLRHSGVVRHLERIGHLTENAKQGFSRRLTVALNDDWLGHPLHVAVFVQNAQAQRVIGAAEQRLPTR